MCINQANNYLFRVNSRNTRNIDIDDVVLVSLMLALNIFYTFFYKLLSYNVNTSYNTM